MFGRGLMDDLADVRPVKKIRFPVLIEERDCLGDRALDHSNGPLMASGRAMRRTEGVAHLTPGMWIRRSASQVAGTYPEVERILAPSPTTIGRSQALPKARKTSTSGRS
jgi:hypothetical protein